MDHSAAFTPPDGAGRFAPTPSGPLHIGNLRTAVFAWLFARSTGRRFYLRVEDLDTDRARFTARQLGELESLGLDWDGEPVFQADRLILYRDAIAELKRGGQVYECFCSRREVREAATAPHGTPDRYPGTCRRLTESQRAQCRRERPAALRLLGVDATATVYDLFSGRFTGDVDDLVVQRRDGTPAYNLAVVVDDARQGIDQVVRGDDLLESAPSQAYLANLLGLHVPDYAHLPLAVNDRGRRLAKRDGDVTLEQLGARGIGAQQVLDCIARSLGGAVDAGPGATLDDLLASFTAAELPSDPWVPSGLFR